MLRENGATAQLVLCDGTEESIPVDHRIPVESLPEQLRKFDFDNDGYLSVVEINAAFATFMDVEQGRFPLSAFKSKDESFRKQLNKLDIDRNGYLGKMLEIQCAN